MWSSDEGKNVSYWQASEHGPSTGPLAGGAEADVCVIGGGIAGLTAAYLLSKAGRSVIVIDDGPIGGGETARTTAHLSWAIDDRLYRIEKWHGEENAKLAVRAHMQAVDEIERISSEENKTAGRLQAYGLHRAVQFIRKNMGLPLPWLTFRRRRSPDQHAGYNAAGIG